MKNKKFIFDYLVPTSFPFLAYVVPQQSFGVQEPCQDSTTKSFDDGKSLVMQIDTMVAKPLGVLAPAITTASPVTSSPSPEILLNGLSHLLQFLFEEEADHLCGTIRHMRSHKRLNYRIGYYARKFRTHIGTIDIRIPHLLHFHPRVPIVKRARRLYPEVLEVLAGIHAAGVTPDKAGVLIKTLWTIELSDELLAVLAGKLVPILEAWRGAGGNA